MTLDERTLRFKHSVCGCVAGLNACLPACGFLQYLAFLARYMRAVDAESQQSGEVPCTSLPRRWGIPSQKRAIAPTVPIDQLNLSHKPKQLECFSPVKASQAEDCERQVEKRPVTPLVDAIRQHANRRVHRGGSPLPMNPPRSFKFRFNTCSKSFACALTECEHVFAIDHGRVSSHAHATFIQLSRI